MLSAALLLVTALGQQPPAPQPFPRPGSQPAKPAPPPSTKPAQPAPAPPSPATTTPAASAAPTEAQLGVPLYPGAQFITSYDAGRGQRFYLFGSTASFVDLVTYYRSVLKQKGELIYDVPATHEFDVGRFREETMAFPPSVVVKDYTWNSSSGYLHVVGTTEKRYRTIIQIVPVK